jgi:ribosome-associated protein
LTDKKRITKGSDAGADRPRIHTSHGTQPRVDKGPRRSLAPRRAQLPKADLKAPSAASGKAGAPRVKKTKVPAPPSPSVASDDARRLAVAIAVAALEKKAVGLEVLDVAGRVDYADFLVLMTGRSDRQVVALAQGIEDELRKKENRRPLSVEGLPHAHWVLMDFGDVVVHVFQDEARGLYDLDGLWMDASRLPLPVPDELRER